MQTVGTFEVKSKLSELLRLGEVINITSHRKSVGKIYPALDNSPEFVAEVRRQLEMLVASGEDDSWEDYADFPEVDE